MKGLLVVVDGDNGAHKLFHAPINRPPAELFGFAMGRIRRSFQPTHMVVVFDALDGYSWRKELHPKYKSNRPPKPPALTQLLVDARAECRNASIPVATNSQHEADDLIAAYTEAGVAAGLEVLIVSSDKDMTQLVRDEPVQVRMHDESRDLMWAPADVFAKFGVAPLQIPDLFALTGDPSDCFLGVPGIGPKKAAPLIREHGTLELLLVNVDDRLALGERLKGPLALLHKHRDDARIAYKLAKLRADIHLPVPLADCEIVKSS